MYTDPTGHYEYNDFVYLPNDALVQIGKYTNDYNSTSYNYLPGDVKFKSKALNELTSHQNAAAVRTFYANYYPRSTEEFSKYYKKYDSIDCGLVFFPKYESSSRLLTLPSGEEITADNIDKLANDPTVRKYFLDNYITNPYEPTETLYKRWIHQFYGYTKKEIKDAKFNEGLENMFFGTVEAGSGALSVAFSGGAMAVIGGGYAVIDGANRMSGGLSQILNSGNDKGETWNFKKNFYNFISPENGEKLYMVDQGIGVALGLFDLYAMAASRFPYLKSTGGFARIPGSGAGVGGGNKYTLNKNFQGKFTAKGTGNNVPTVNTPSVNSNVVRVPEIKSQNQIKFSDATQRWDNYLGNNQTNINPRTGQPDPDRIFSADQTKSIRFTKTHEMPSFNTTKPHYHEETWTYDPITDTFTVTNYSQRLKQ